MTLGIFDIHSPLTVAAHRVHAETDNLGVPLLEFRLQAGHVTQFRGAHGRKVFGMREQDGPAVTDPFVKIYRALRSFGSEIGSFVVYRSMNTLLRRGYYTQFGRTGLTRDIGGSGSSQRC